MTDEITLPPWSKKRRITTASVIVAFILISAGFIGFGVYQVGLQAGVIIPMFNEKSVLQSLMQDAGFYRAVKHSMLQRACTNQTLGFYLSYAAPLHPTGTDCTTFITTHPTGRTTVISLEAKKQSRISLVNSLTQQFTSVQTEILSGTAYETSSMMGIIDGTLTHLYVIGVMNDVSWLVTYAPTSPLVDTKVQDLVFSFRLDHK